MSVLHFARVSTLLEGLTEGNIPQMQNCSQYVPYFIDLMVSKFEVAHCGDYIFEMCGIIGTVYGYIVVLHIRERI